MLVFTIKAKFPLHIPDDPFVRGSDQSWHGKVNGMLSCYSEVKQLSHRGSNVFLWPRFVTCSVFSSIMPTTFFFFLEVENYFGFNLSPLIRNWS